METCVAYQREQVLKESGREIDESQQLSEIEQDDVLERAEAMKVSLCLCLCLVCFWALGFRAFGKLFYGSDRILFLWNILIFL
jgi:hypothetical protein